MVADVIATMGAGEMTMIDTIDATDMTGALPTIIGEALRKSVYTASSHQNVAINKGKEASRTSIFWDVTSITREAN